METNERGWSEVTSAGVSSSEDRITVSLSCAHSVSLADSGGEKRLRGVTAGLDTANILGDGVVRRLLAGDGVNED